MRNWVGHDLQEGDYVWRGASEGNSSCYRFGRIYRINDGKSTAAVEWLAEASQFHLWDITGDRSKAQEWRSEQFPMVSYWGARKSTVPLQSLTLFNFEPVDFGFGSTGKAEFLRVLEACNSAKQRVKEKQYFLDEHDLMDYIANYIPA